MNSCIERKEAATLLDQPSEKDSSTEKEIKRLERILLDTVNL